MFEVQNIKMLLGVSKSDEVNFYSLLSQEDSKSLNKCAMTLKLKNDFLTIYICYMKLKTEF